MQTLYYPVTWYTREWFPTNICRTIVCYVLCRQHAFVMQHGLRRARYEVAGVVTLWFELYVKIASFEGK
jgi:hypothetical protein